MASIPLPALDVRPPVQQADPLEQYGRLMQLRNMQQNAPLQTQALQQNVQQGQIDVQQKQQQLKDQQAITAAMQNWDGKDYNDILPLVVKNGGSGQAVLGLKQKILEQQQSLSTAFKNNSQGAEAQATAMKTKGDLLDGALAPLVDPKQTSDAQLPQAIQSTAQSLIQRGLLDPQHAQAAAQIAQLGDPTAMRQQIDLLRKGNMAQSQMVDEAQKQAQTQEAQATAGKTQAEMNYYQQNGGAPGVPVESQELTSYLKNNPGKTPQDFVAWKARQSPMAMVMGNQLSPAATALAAQNLLETGQGPQGMYRSPGSTAAVYNQAAALNSAQGGAGMAATKADYQANAGSLKKLQTNFDQVQAFEQTAEKNMNLLQSTAQKIPDLGARFANVPVRMVNSQMIGTANMAAFKTALATAQTEAAKVLNSSNATGVLSDSSRHELQDIIDGNMPLPAMVASLNTLKQDMANRTQAYQQQIGDIQQRINSPGGSSAGANPQSNANDPFAQFGGKAH